MCRAALTGLAADVRDRYIRSSPKGHPQQGAANGHAPNQDACQRQFGTQRKRPERGRYLLQVDRQTKGSYTTSEAAQAAALVIKKSYPIVQVTVYDSVDNSNTLIEAPGASS
jgi:hypothetical protein